VNSKILGLLAVGLLAGPLTASAALSLRLSDGVTTISVPNGSAHDANGAAGAATPKLAAAGHSASTCQRPLVTAKPRSAGSTSNVL